MIKANTRRGDFFGGYYEVISSFELEERGHKDDCRWGISIDIEKTSDGKMYWSTHEYNAERPDCYYNGHYFMENKSGAWKDFFKRCNEMMDYARKWEAIKRDECHLDNE